MARIGQKPVQRIRTRSVRNGANELTRVRREPERGMMGGFYRGGTNATDRRRSRSSPKGEVLHDQQDQFSECCGAGD